MAAEARKLLTAGAEGPGISASGSGCSARNLPDREPLSPSFRMVVSGPLRCAETTYKRTGLMSGKTWGFPVSSPDSRRFCGLGAHTLIEGGRLIWSFI
jgi:hypothetical protein